MSYCSLVATARRFHAFFLHENPETAGREIAVLAISVHQLLVTE